MFSFGLSFPCCTKPPEDPRTTSVVHKILSLTNVKLTSSLIFFQNQIYMNFPHHFYKKISKILEVQLNKIASSKTQDLFIDMAKHI